MDWFLLWSISVSQKNGSQPVTIKSKYGSNNETYEIQLLNATESTLKVDLKFTSQLSSTLQGFYRVGYNDVDDKNKK